jgi:glycosyltransferase involved in cell wall biosynthesis
MEQLGQSQILPYLRYLAQGRPITLVTFEKGFDKDDATRRARFTALTKEAGIRWIALRYHRWPATVSTAYDLALGLLVCAFQCLTQRVQIVHARGYVPSVVALILKRVFGVRYIFDMRGFWVTQQVELGKWRDDSAIFRIARWFENHFLREADVVFALTIAAVDAMRQWPAVAGRQIRFEVVTTCTDLALFRPPPDDVHVNRGAPFTLGYVGNAGTGYLFEQVLEFFLELRQRRPDARLKIVNRYDHVAIRTCIRMLGIPSDAVDLSSCDHAEVPANMWQMDAGVFFVRPDPSRISSVPTRMGEFLACGVPCVSNAGLADVVEILEGAGVGVAVRDFQPESLQRAVEAILDLSARPEVRENCVRVARDRYSLEAGVATYESTYRMLEAASRAQPR